MKAPTIVDAIRSLVPGAEFAIRAGVVEWIVPAIAPVTSQQITDALAQLTAAWQTDQTRTDAIDATITADTTIASLKAMSNADYDTWWAANVTTSAQAIAVLKRVTRIVLRRAA